MDDWVVRLIIWLAIYIFANLATLEMNHYHNVWAHPSVSKEELKQKAKKRLITTNAVVIPAIILLEGFIRYTY